MGCLPYFKFYPADWLSDRKVRRLSPEARSLYWDLLCVAWQEGGIPADAQELALDAKHWGYSRRSFAKVWAEIEQFWVHGADGLLVNVRQEDERTKALAIYKQRIAAGKKGGRPPTSNGSKRAGVRKANG